VSINENPVNHLKVVTDNDRIVPAVSLIDFNVWFDEMSILSSINTEISYRGVTCLVGPSGAGKSTFLRTLNRINDEVQGYRHSGQVQIEGKNLSDFKDITHLRKKVGMVFQRPCVFPGSIEKNVLFGVKGKKMSIAERSDLIEDSLRKASLWSEVKGRLKESALGLSLGQQQRLCMARTLAIKPDIILLDEPTASIDPVSVRAIEDAVKELSKEATVIMVTHNIAQAKRIGDHIMFLCAGELVESGPVNFMFSRNSLSKTQEYLGDEYCDC